MKKKGMVLRMSVGHPIAKCTRCRMELKSLSIEPPPPAVGKGLKTPALSYERNCSIPGDLHHIEQESNRFCEKM